MLILPIKKKWFDMIRSGEKKEEYREIKPYWTKRLNNELDRMLKSIIPSNVERDLRKYPQWLMVKFRNGYRKDSPTIMCGCKIIINKGKEEWGAEPNKEYYILEILEILEVQNIGKE